MVAGSYMRYTGQIALTYPHPSQYIGDLGLFDIVLAVLPLDEGCPITGHIAPAAIPGELYSVQLQPPGAPYPAFSWL